MPSIINVNQKTLNIFYLLDTSGSMTGSKIDQLNHAMRQVLPLASKLAISSEINLSMRVIEFNTSHSWYIGDAANGVKEATWNDLTASGGTDTAGAIQLVTETLKDTSNLGINPLRPVVILITDGESNNSRETYAAIDNLKNVLKKGEKDKTTRIAIAVDGANMSELEYFATVGTIIDGGNKQLNQPFIFQVDDINRLGGILRAVTESSIVGAQNMDPEGKQELVVTPPEPDQDTSGPSWL